MKPSETVSSRGGGQPLRFVPDVSRRGRRRQVRRGLGCGRWGLHAPSAARTRYRESSPASRCLSGAGTVGSTSRYGPTTVFAKSKLGIHKWLLASYLMTVARKGISSVHLAKEVGGHAENGVVFGLSNSGGDGIAGRPAQAGLHRRVPLHERQAPVPACEGARWLGEHQPHAGKVELIRKTL